MLGGPGEGWGRTAAREDEQGVSHGNEFDGDGSVPDHPFHPVSKLIVLWLLGGQACDGRGGNQGAVGRLVHLATAFSIRSNDLMADGETGPFQCKGLYK